MQDKPQGLLHCGQLDHIKRDCPNRTYRPRRGESSASTASSQARTGPSIPRTDARMFAMTRQEAQYDPGVISGPLSICDMDAYVLIDPGSTHSYISFVFAQHIDRMVDWLDSPLVVAMPAGDPS